MTTLGRFQIVSELGRGGMGVVYRAHDPDMARDVAIKVLRSDLALSGAEAEEIARRFDREARSAGALNHPNIVAHYERGEFEGNRYIVMELVDGQSLHQLMTSGVRPGLQSSLEILRQTASALDYAHSRGVVHRDIKPGNILIQAGCVVKVADFGIAKSMLAGAATAASMMIGSPHYMAPEQIEGQPITGRTDQWALAITAYELLAGRKPFESDSIASLFHQILGTPPPEPGDPRLTAARPAFEKALNKAPANRYETCSDFASELRLLLESKRSGAEPTATPSNARGKRVPVWIAAALAAMVAAAAARFTLPHNSKPVASPAAAVQTAPAEVRSPGQTRINRRDSQTYVWIPPGTFRMGCSPADTDCHDDEFPRGVSIERGFWLAQTETTVGAYKLYARATGVKLPAAPDFDPGWGNETVPITGIAWDVAVAYCNWAQGRLPTESEWEFAARAGTPEARYGPLTEIAWFKGNSGTRPHQIKTRQPNAFGLYDMLGNVWEWTAGAYDPAGNFHVLRGGSWLREASEVRASHRSPVSGSNPDHATGMRCAAGILP